MKKWGKALREKEMQIAIEQRKNPETVGFTLIRKYLQQLITNADRQGANRNRELIL